MPDTFSFVVTYTARDSIRAILLYRRTRRGAKLVLALLISIAVLTVGCLFPVSYFYGHQIDFSNYLFSNVCASTLFGIIILSVWFELPAQLIIRWSYFRNKKKLSNPYQFQVDEKGIAIQIEHAKAVYEWAYFDMVLENRVLYAFLHDGKASAFVPKRIFTADELSRFSTFLRERLSERMRFVKG